MHVLPNHWIIIVVQIGCIAFGSLNWKHIIHFFFVYTHVIINRNAKQSCLVLSL